MLTEMAGSVDKAARNRLVMPLTLHPITSYCANDVTLFLPRPPSSTHINHVDGPRLSQVRVHFNTTIWELGDLDDDICASRFIFPRPLHHVNPSHATSSTAPHSIGQGCPAQTGRAMHELALSGWAWRFKSIPIGWSRLTANVRCLYKGKSEHPMITCIAYRCSARLERGELWWND